MTRILLPGLRRHIADVKPAPLYGPGVVEYEALCDGRRKIAGDGFLDQCDPADTDTLSDQYVCPACLAAHQPTEPAEDPTMGTIPLFDL